jgi:hypothetical protein
MTLTERDLRKLALPLLIALAAVRTAGALAGGTLREHPQAGLERQRAARPNPASNSACGQFHTGTDLKTRLQSLHACKAAASWAMKQRLDWWCNARHPSALRLPA